MKKAMAFVVAFLLLAGCYDILRYTETQYRYTITLPVNSTLICEFAVGDLTNVTYSMTADAPLDFKLFDVDVVVLDPETGITNVTFTELKRIESEQNLYVYEDKVELEEGLYNIVFYGCDKKTKITMNTNIGMDCG